MSFLVASQIICPFTFVSITKKFTLILSYVVPNQKSKQIGKKKSPFIFFLISLDNLLFDN